VFPVELDCLLWNFSGMLVEQSCHFLELTKQHYQDSNNLPLSTLDEISIEITPL